MQAIITKYFPHTNTKPARIQAKCYRGTKYTSIHSDKMIESLASNDVANHRIAAKELIDSFMTADTFRHGIAGNAGNPWNKNFVSGQLPSGDYVHVFID